MATERLTLNTVSNSTLLRARRIVLVAATVGLLVNMGLFAGYVAVEGVHTVLIINNMVYNLLLLALIVSSFTGRLFSLVVPTGMLLIYSHLWITSFVGAGPTQSTVLDLPVLLAVPLCLVLVSGYRTLIVLALVQALLVHAYVPLYLPHTYGVDWSPDEQTTYARVLAAMSFVSLALMAIVAYLREQTDSHLAELLTQAEKLADEDPLTGLLNRRALMDTVRACVSTGDEGGVWIHRP